MVYTCRQCGNLVAAEGEPLVCPRCYSPATAAFGKGTDAEHARRRRVTQPLPSQTERLLPPKPEVPTKPRSRSRLVVAIWCALGLAAAGLTWQWMGGWAPFAADSAEIPISATAPSRRWRVTPLAEDLGIRDLGATDAPVADSHRSDVRQGDGFPGLDLAPMTRPQARAASRSGTDGGTMIRSSNQSTSVNSSKPLDPAARETAETLYRVGVRQLLAGQSPAALSSFEAAAARDPSFGDAHRGQGLAHEKLGNTASAREAFERYLVLHPDASDAAIVRKHLDGLTPGRSPAASGAH